MSSGSGVQLAFKLIPKLFSAVEVRGWPLEFFHTNLCTTCFNEPCFVHGSIAALEQVCSSSWLLHCFQLIQSNDDSEARTEYTRVHFGSMCLH